MYLWDFERLTHVLRDHKIARFNPRPYYIAYAIILLFYIKLYYFFFYFSQPERPWLTILEAWWILLAAGGWFGCYWANKQGDNKNFLTRMVCLAVPLNIRTMVYVLFPAVITVVGIYLLVGTTDLPAFIMLMAWSWPVVSLLIYMYLNGTYYGMLYEEMRKVAQ